MRHLKIASGMVFITALWALPALAQETLPEVVVTAANYKYLKSVSNTGQAQPVKMLQHKAAAYSIKDSEYYEEDYDNYFISFYIPEGELLAAYDKDGKLIRTAEKYKNIALPTAVSAAVVDRFPQWTVSDNTYQVTFFDETGSKKIYKLLLRNGDKRMKVKINDKGEFL
jgi:hypothetical protein